ncbi:biotin transporter BioY [Halovenus sp. WSH3]|uniref:Biotin transporter BioY n=1 Tax=Halovenus carboxidivorans TaxID=2692199 RepID=A0A6B0TD56_9EURY|nr:biotin transporter BioY [Halovenus carboxidivorans]MXR53171.1 biotin transporter BioY [Halovenus carboxidivorans]
MASNGTETVELVEKETIRNFSRAVVIAALTAVLAQFSIPLPGGIPFSFQPFGVFFAGLVLGPLWGGCAIALYVLTGVAGAPVFSNATGGLGVIAGPTGGFLLGFVAGAVVIGAVAHRRPSPRPVETLTLPWVLVGLLGGLVPIYVVGVSWLSAVAGLGLPQAATSMAPFFLGDLLKVAISVAVVATHGELLGRV